MGGRTTDSGPRATCKRGNIEGTFSPIISSREVLVRPTRVTQIPNEQSGIGTDTVLRLARCFGTTSEFWMDSHSDYGLRRARHEVGDVILRNVTPRVARMARSTRAAFMQACVS